jgi:hypothetical protein
MATTTVAAPRVQTAERKVANPAAVRDNRWRNVQLILFAAGAVMMPLGIVVIGLGWYGTAHSHYDYDQRTYLISGGIMGLGVTFFGGFLYFGAWLAKMAADQRDSSRQIAESLLALADVVSRQQGGGAVATSGPATAELGGALVFAGDGTTVHRRDCPLIAHRDDLRPISGDEIDPTLCRVCKPELGTTH